MIIETIKQNSERKILLLSDRIEHLNILENMLKNEIFLCIGSWKPK